MCDISLTWERICNACLWKHSYLILRLSFVLCLNTSLTFFFSFCSPELEKGLKKRVKLHTHENGENGQSRENGQNGQNEDNDSDDNYTEVSDTMSEFIVV